MSKAIITLAQFIFILWPLFLATALVYSLQVSATSRRPRRIRIKASLVNLAKRIRRNLLATWAVLLAFWAVTLFADGPTPGLLPDPWNISIFLGGFVLLLFSEVSELGLFQRRLLAHVSIHRAQYLSDLKAMDPYAFEALVAETYHSLGYRVQRVGHSGDHGIDVELHTREGAYWVVQCKRYHGSVGEGIVRELYGTMISERADRAVLVTTAEITPPARTWAQGKPIDLVDGSAFLDLVQRARREAEGTLFDRLALFLGNLLLPHGARPPGLAASQPAAGYEDTRPVRVHPAPVIAYQSGVPVCPVHHLPMVAHPSRGSGRALYRCPHYPACRVVLEAQPVEA